MEHVTDPTQLHFLTTKGIKVGPSETERLIEESRQIREMLWDKLQQELEMIDLYAKNGWKE